MASPLIEISCIFGRLGAFGFGGPIATMAMMEEEVVRKRSWISPARFAEVYSIVKILPGPAATQMAIHLGMSHAGRLGGFLAGFLFVFPSFLLVLGLAMLYGHFQGAADRSLIFPAMQAGALAVIAASTAQLSKPYRHRPDAISIALVSLGIVVFRPSLEPLIILIFGILGARRAMKSATLTGAGVAVFASAVAGTQAAFATTAQAALSGVAALPALFWTCFKAGAFVFGTGLAIVPLLEGDMVQHYGWLTHSEFMNALAVGQITPGPVVITVTFIGYKVAGIAGAVVATVGIFLAPFFNMLFIVPRVWNRMSQTPGAQGFSAWAMPAVIGCILGTTSKLGFLTLQSLWLIAIFFLAIFALGKMRISAWKVIPLCGALGGLFQLFH